MICYTLDLYHIVVFGIECSLPRCLILSHSISPICLLVPSSFLSPHSCQQYLVSTTQYIISALNRAQNYCLIVIFVNSATSTVVTLARCNLLGQSSKPRFDHGQAESPSELTHCRPIFDSVYRWHHTYLGQNWSVWGQHPR